MDIYNWVSEEERHNPQDRGLQRSANYKMATVTMRWNGESTEMLLDPLWIYETWLVAFRPVGIAPERALIVAEPQNNNFLEIVVRDRFDALSPSELNAEKLEKEWVERCAHQIEIGNYARFRAKNAAENFKSGYCVAEIFDSRGWMSARSYESFISIGSYLHRTSQELENLDYDPEMFAQPWCEVARAPETLCALDETQFARFLVQEFQNPDSVGASARRWKNYSLPQRREALPALEREIEREVCRVMGWALASEPNFRAADEDDENLLISCLWRRPRFIARPEPEFGLYFYDMNWQIGGFPSYAGLNFKISHQDESADEAEAEADSYIPEERRLRAIWAHVERAFAPQIAQLCELGALHPSVAHWCHFRGAYIVAPEVPTAHEKIESHVALRDWLRERAGVELDEIERELGEN